MSPNPIEPSAPIPDKIIVAILIGEPGAVCVMSQDGYPLAIRPLPDLTRGELFASDGLLSQVLHHTPDVGSIAKVVIAPDHLGLAQGSSDKLTIRGGVGYLYTLLTWLKLPVIVAPSGWLAHYAAIYEGRSALSIIREFPDFFDQAHASEDCARAAILGFLAVTNPDWAGVDMVPTALPPVSEDAATVLH